jgi:hypothetical protein
MKTVASLFAVSVIALVICVRCSEPVHQCGLDINCGDPGGLQGDVAPGPPNAKGQDSNNQKTTGTGMGDGGGSTAGFTGCLQADGKTVLPLANPDGGGCTISFKNDLLAKKLGAAGTWGCAKSQCHDPQGGVAPKIDVMDPLGTYTNLYNSGSGTAPYINPCSEDPTKSEILGNLANPSTAGAHMPQDNTALPAQADIDMIVKPWVTCGAPLN